MSKTVGQLVAQVLEEGSFDASEAAALGWLDECHQLMCARTKCYRRRLEVGPTVAEQQGYPIPAEVQEIREVQVQSSAASGGLGVPYGAGRHSDLAQGALHYIWLGGLYLGAGGGIFVRDENAEGRDVLALFPVPTESGLKVTVFAVCRPEPLTLSPPALVVGNTATIRFSSTTRVLTEAERAAFVAGGGLPAGIGTEAGVASVVFEYRLPGGAWTVGAVTKDAVGAYHATVALTAAGELEWRARGLGPLGGTVWSVQEDDWIGVGGSQVKVPQEFVGALVDGAIATGLMRVEGRPDLSAPFESKFSGACTELLRQQNQRFRNTGPVQIRVQSFNA